MGEGVVGLGQSPEDEEIDPIERGGHDPDLHLVRRADGRSGHLDGLDLFEAAEALHRECPHGFWVLGSGSLVGLQKLDGAARYMVDRCPRPEASPRAAGFAAGSRRRKDAMREFPNMEMGWSGQGWMDPMPSTPPPPPPAPEPMPEPAPKRSQAALAAATVIAVEVAVVAR